MLFAGNIDLPKKGWRTMFAPTGVA